MLYASSFFQQFHVLFCLKCVHALSLYCSCSPGVLKLLDWLTLQEHETFKQMHFLRIHFCIQLLTSMLPLKLFKETLLDLSIISSIFSSA